MVAGGKGSRDALVTFLFPHAEESPTELDSNSDPVGLGGPENVHV